MEVDLILAGIFAGRLAYNPYVPGFLFLACLALDPQLISSLLGYMGSQASLGLQPVRANRDSILDLPSCLLCPCVLCKETHQGHS